MIGIRPQTGLIRTERLIRPLVANNSGSAIYGAGDHPVVVSKAGDVGFSKRNGQFLRLRQRDHRVDGTAILVGYRYGVSCGSETGGIRSISNTGIAPGIAETTRASGSDYRNSTAIVLEAIEVRAGNVDAQGSGCRNIDRIGGHTSVGIGYGHRVHIFA